MPTTQERSSHINTDLRAGLPRGPLPASCPGQEVLPPPDRKCFLQLGFNCEGLRCLPLSSPRTLSAPTSSTATLGPSTVDWGVLWRSGHLVIRHLSGLERHHPGLGGLSIRVYVPGVLGVSRAAPPVTSGGRRQQAPYVSGISGCSQNFLVLFKLSQWTSNVWR